jgi:hypothetical protein
MKKYIFWLFTMAAFFLLLFSLYLNFFYKGGDSEFAPIKKGTTDSTLMTNKS